MNLRNLMFQAPGRGGFRLGPLDLEGPADRPWLILGRSGSGKTTFLRLLGGNLRPSEGTIEGIRPGEDTAYLPQFPERALAGRNLAEDLGGRLRPPQAERARLRKALAALGLDGVPLSRRSRELSAGERRRVALALLELTGYPHWALDEPDAALDAPGLAALLAGLRRRTGSGRLWIATHRFELYAPLAPWCVVLEGGALVASGSLVEILQINTARNALSLDGRPTFAVWNALRKTMGENLVENLPGKPPSEGGRLAQVHGLLMDRAGFG